MTSITLGNNQIKVLSFDFDGVILESFDIKTEAFRELFQQYPQHVDQIVEYHKQNGGISRYIKFGYIYSSILGLPLDEDGCNALGERFSKIVFDKILSCPFVDGTLEFLEKCFGKVPMYIASGTPEGELREIVESRKLSHYFAGVYGSPATKASILRRIMEHENVEAKEIAFVGDAITDLKAARETSVVFVGRNQTEDFSGVADYVIRDFNDLQPLLR